MKATEEKSGESEIEREKRERERKWEKGRERERKRGGKERKGREEGDNKYRPLVICLSPSCD